MRTLHTASLLLLALVALSSYACAASPEQAILGKWQEILADGRTDSTIEFFEDGTVAAVDGKRYVAGDYKFLDQNRIKVTLGGGALAGPLILEISISGDLLTMKSPDGKVEKYKRLK